MPLPLLNDQNLPYPDTIHPIIVHFVIAMVFFSYFCDVTGYLSRNHRMFEVSWWNLVVASIAVFAAVILGEFEAGLAQPYSVVQPVLNWHTVNGWSIAVILVVITAWRGIIRVRDPLKVPVVYLGTATFLMCLVCLQVYLGSLVVWVYGLHTVPVVEATRQGLLK
ncbi:MULTISPECIES: DUF2231 domain-containing protein [unclassified Leptolyngbya]|uniref:DUF2231 domain-containing protein n=1 Tax=unclassified Leptolyngbya TaxID=2650499 RepID=UPI001689DD11|nr:MULTISPECIES: DUF2231 domain-containing protein [unclassified Leptolyngbya]MBD1910011.1 DUF2231 domain-containing protein [Leptolyngbya sp. FACHB-8]MBD2158824.1 DUF2231 domain-containing protein [Leptolyngbya sp. FACHB-16]